MLEKKQGERQVGRPPAHGARHQYIIENAKVKFDKDIAKHLGMTVDSVRKMRQRLGIKKSIPWIKEKKDEHYKYKRLRSYHKRSALAEVKSKMEEGQELDDTEYLVMKKEIERRMRMRGIVV